MLPQTTATASFFHAMAPVLTANIYRRLCVLLRDDHAEGLRARRMDASLICGSS